MSSNKKTFTLIEMLIVIVIIGILAAALVPRLQAVQGRARDTKRKTDFRSVAQALDVYLLDNGVYPLSTGCTKYGTGGDPAKCYGYVSYLQPLTGGYMTSLPEDPINVYNGTYGTLGTGSYQYYYGNVYNTVGGTYNSYDLVGLLENTKDPLGCHLSTTTYYWRYWGQGVTLCGGSSPYSFQQLPYSR